LSVLEELVFKKLIKWINLCTFCVPDPVVIANFSFILSATVYLTKIESKFIPKFLNMIGLWAFRRLESILYNFFVITISGPSIRNLNYFSDIVVDYR